MELPHADHLDRLSIVLLKIAHGIADLEEARALAADILPPYLLDLLLVNAEIWSLEAALKSGHEDQLPLDEIGRRAIAIRNWNRQRIALRNTIATETGGFLDHKRDHLSATPTPP